MGRRNSTARHRLWKLDRLTNTEPAIGAGRMRRFRRNHELERNSRAVQPIRTPASKAGSETSRVGSGHSQRRSEPHKGEKHPPASDEFFTDHSLIPQGLINIPTTPTASSRGVRTDYPPHKPPALISPPGDLNSHTRPTLPTPFFRDQKQTEAFYHPTHAPPLPIAPSIPDDSSKLKHSSGPGPDINHPISTFILNTNMKRTPH